MKRHFLSIILPFMAISLFAQTAKEDIHNNIKLSAANYVAYMDPAEPLTPAPKKMLRPPLATVTRGTASLTQRRANMSRRSPVRMAVIPW